MGLQGVAGEVGPMGLQGVAGEVGPIGDNLWGQNQNNIYYINGQVGIGTNTPTYDLDVNGITQFQSSVFCNTNLNTTTKSSKLILSNGINNVYNLDYNMSDTFLLGGNSLSDNFSPIHGNIILKINNFPLSDINTRKTITLIYQTDVSDSFIGISGGFENDSIYFPFNTPNFSTKNTTFYIQKIEYLFLTGDLSFVFSTINSAISP